MVENLKRKLFLFRLGKFLIILLTAFLCHYLTYKVNSEYSSLIILSIVFSFGAFRSIYTHNYFMGFKEDKSKYTHIGFSFFVYFLVSIIVYLVNWQFIDELQFSLENPYMDYTTAKTIHSGYGPLVVAFICFLDSEIIKQEIKV